MGSEGRHKKSQYNTIRYAAGTDIGLKRSVNEDSWVVADGSKKERATVGGGIMLAVADGIGGHSGGHIASKMACDGIRSYFEEDYLLGDERRSPEEDRKKLAAILFRIDEEIRAKSHEDGALSDMGTTLSAMVISERQAVVVHVGDSRVYRLRDQNLTRLTPDHTFVQEMVDEGEVQAKDVWKHPLRHMLTSALGTEEPLETYFVDTYDLKRGDRFLLCSDGLTNMVSDRIIAELLKDENDPESIVSRMIEEALANGGKDNVTVIVVEKPLKPRRIGNRRRDAAKEDIE